MAVAIASQPFRRPPELGGGTPLHSVAIVGGGPVGLTLALTLARHGVQAVVLEDEDRVCTGSRALGMSRRTLEIWDSLGAAAGIAAHGVAWSAGRTFWREREVLQFRMADDPRLKFRPMLNIQQCHAEQFLVEAVQRHPGIDLRWQQRVTGVRQDADGVRLAVQTPQGGYELRARHAVACDGARSTVREALGLRLEGSTHDACYLIADIRLRSDAPMERRCWFDPPSNPGSTVLMHGQPEGIWRLDCQLPPGDDAQAALRPDALRERIARHLAFIGERGEWELVWASVYRAHSRALASFRHGRVFFAGDAAHLMPIFGIRGLNSGIEDAWNLGWKLAEVHQGRAPDALLDGYSVERRRAFEENVALADRNASVMSPPSPGWRLLRDAVLELAPLRRELGEVLDPKQAGHVPLRDSPFDTPDEDSWALGPAPGHPVPELVLPGTGHSLHECFAPGWNGLLFVDPQQEPPRTRDLMEACSALGVHGVALHPDSLLHAGFGAGPGAFYLVRPDHHVAARWKSPDLARVTAALRRGRGEGLLPAASQDAPPVDLPAAERIYRAIGAALEGDAQGHARLLAKIALVLALELGDPEAVRRAVATALSEIPSAC